MKLDFDKVLLARGKPIKMDDAGTDATLGEIVCASLIASTESGLTAEERYERGALAERVFFERERDFSDGEIALMKQTLSSCPNNAVVYACFQILEGKA